MPEVEVFDRTTETWLALPHLAQGATYELSDPAGYVDPATGSIDLRFVNDRQDTVGFSFSIALEGIVR
jgi:hypothetical protein